MRCDEESRVAMIGPREIKALTFSQPAKTGQRMAAAGKASAQNELTLITEIVSVRIVFIFNCSKCLLI